jgi:hypothetical protein
MPDCRLHIILERPESARRLRPCERCPCPPRIAKQKQCKHDFAAGDTFDKDKWSHRHFQVEALPPHVLGSALPDTDSLDGDNHDDDNNNDGDGDGNDDDGDNSAGHHDDNGSRDFSADHTDSDNSGTNQGLFAKDEETLIAESGRRSEIITQHTEAPVLFSDLSKKMAEIQSVVAILSQGKQRMFMGALDEFLRVARGGSGTAMSVVDNLSMALLPGHSQISTAGMSRPPPTSGLLRPIPVLAHGARPGATSTKRKRKLRESFTTKQTVKKGKGYSCTFCGESGHNIAGCKSCRKYGKHLKNSDVKELIGRLFSAVQASKLPEGIVTEDKPMLKSLPPKARWLVVHNQHYLHADVRPKLQLSNLALLVTVLGDEGRVIHARQLATAITANEWMAKKGNASTGKSNRSSRVFSTMEDEAMAVPASKRGIHPEPDDDPSSSESEDELATEEEAMAVLASKRGIHPEPDDDPTLLSSRVAKVVPKAVKFVAKVAKAVKAPKAAKISRAAKAPEAARVPKVAKAPETARVPKVAKALETARVPKAAKAPKRAKAPKAAASSDEESDKKPAALFDPKHSLQALKSRLRELLSRTQGLEDEYNGDRLKKAIASLTTLIAKREGEDRSKTKAKTIARTKVANTKEVAAVAMMDDDDSDDSDEDKPLSALKRRSQRTRKE